LCFAWVFCKRIVLFFDNFFRSRTVVSVLLSILVCFVCFYFYFIAGTAGPLRNPQHFVFVRDENRTSKQSPCSLFKSKMDNTEPFDIGLVKAAFEICLSAEALDMDQYVIAYKELSRFFRLLGSAFGFVAQDVDDKIGILEKHRASDLSEHYSTIDGMLKYETDSGLADSGHSPAGGKLPSGARTLLRLHRALEFVILFLAKVKDAPEDSGTSGIARECYDASLAKYHPWLIRKGANMAMYLLPSRKTLVSSMCKSTVEEATALVAEVIKSGQTIFDKTQTFYSERSLLELA